VSSSDRLRTAPSELGRFLASCRGAFLGIGLMTAMINVLYPTASFFMLEIYEALVALLTVPVAHPELLQRCSEIASPNDNRVIAVREEFVADNEIDVAAFNGLTLDLFG
jgi:hypothetical protein